MPYYQTVQSRHDYARAVSSRNWSSFEALQKDGSVEGGPSQWGQAHLFACRVYCRQPTDILSVLAHRIRPRSEDGIHDCIDKLIAGPREARQELQQMAEPQIVRAYEIEGLGYTWAALAPLLRQDQSNLQTLTSNRSTRERTQRDLTGFVSSQDLQIGSSPADRPNTASSAPSSVGYIEGSYAPLAEDCTIRFLSCFIRCVLNYAQPVDKVLPYVQYRDMRLMYRSEADQDQNNPLVATDDGGVQIMQLDTGFQVAILEAKRDFQDINDGVPMISDKLLAQVVGEALALRLSETRCIYNEVIAIVAVKHYVKILQVHISESFLQRFRTLDPHEQCTDHATFIPIDSTHWWNLADVPGRRFFVRHILALIAWADDASWMESDSDSSNDSMDIE